MQSCLNWRRYMTVSIHAPVWGATVRFWVKAKQSKCFNPRTRVGCDSRGWQLYNTLGVSIHAPVWGATFGVLSSRVASGFQSTHPCGVRLQLQRICTTQPTFQSTHPCGVRPVDAAFVCATYGFNPRTRVGCDVYRYNGKTNNWVSIHAPVWGATRFERPC